MLVSVSSAALVLWGLGLMLWEWDISAALMLREWDRAGEGFAPSILLTCCQPGTGLL